MIRADLLAKRHGLSYRQTKAVQTILQCGQISIKDFEKICSDTQRRTLQRDLKDLIDKKIILAEGGTNQLIYKLAT